MRALASSNRKAHYYLGLRFSDPTVPADLNKEKALSYFQKSADENDSKGCYMIGCIYYYGLGVTKDYEKAIKYLKKSAAKSHPGANNLLGEVLIGLMMQWKLIMIPLDRVVEGVIYHKGINDVLPANLKDSFDHFSAAARHLKDIDEVRHKLYCIAIGELEEGIEGMCNLGQCYMRGDGCDKDARKAYLAFEACCKLSEAISRGSNAVISSGNVRAMYCVGWCLRFGEGVGKNVKQAVVWLRKAAEADYHKAQYELGMCYLKGKGVDKDETEARGWLEKSAAQGNLHAKEALFRHAHALS